MSESHDRALTNFALAMLANPNLDTSADATHAIGVAFEPVRKPAARPWSRLHIDWVRGMRFAKGPNTRNWHGYRVGPLLIVLHGGLREALVNAVFGRLNAVNEHGAELVTEMFVLDPSADRRERFVRKVQLATLTIRAKALHLTLGALEQGARTWR